MSPEEAFDSPTARPTDQASPRESALEDLSREVVQALRKGEYSSIKGSPTETKNVVDNILEQTGSEFLVLRQPVTQEGTTLPQITDSFEAIAPHGSSEALSESFSAALNFGELFESIATKSNKPVIAILENVQNVKKEWRADLLRVIRALFNARANVRKVTWLLTGTAHPYELMPEDFGTPYNIGRSFNIPESPQVLRIV